MVCLVSGGNIDVTILNRVITRGLAKGGRICSISLGLSDKPGQLSAVCDIIGRQGGNILSVTHERTTNKGSINDCELHLELETRNNQHIKQIHEALKAAGFEIL